MILLFLTELVLLFLLSRRLTSELSYFFYGIFKSRKVAAFLMAAIFLPGTIIHEFSHALMAQLLFVHVGKMELMPRIEGESLKLGSVEVGKTDVFRNFFIGIAPFLVGTGLLLGIVYAAIENDIFGFNIWSIGILYTLFVIANTMYSSRKDMEGAIQFLIVTLLPAAFFYFLGVRIPGVTWEALNSGRAEQFFTMACIFLGVPLVLDFAFVLFAKIIRR